MSLVHDDIADDAEVKPFSFGHRGKGASSKAPAVVGPYSHAISVGNLLFCAGQIGVDPATNELSDSVEAQTKQTLENLKAVLTEAGFGLDEVVKAEIFLADIKDYKIVNEVYGSYFPGNKPARQAVAAAALPRAALVEISFIAARGD